MLMARDLVGVDGLDEAMDEAGRLILRYERTTTRIAQEVMRRGRARRGRVSDDPDPPGEPSGAESRRSRIYRGRDWVRLVWVRSSSASTACAVICEASRSSIQAAISASQTN
jgi:hypothetical protein